MKIFIVDDNKGMRMLIRHCIREAGFNGHNFVEYENGLDALNNIAKEMPNLILCDWNMPKMTGIEFLNGIRAKVESKELKQMIPFVFVTSESTDEMLDKAKQAGASGLITKPFTSDVFEKKLAAFID